MSGAAKGRSAIADQRQRERCLDVTQSFVVQAPAGSGKTGLLVLRFLALLARVERPEAVLAITFTRKAAGEMRQRIVAALLDAESRREAPPEGFERQRHELARAVLERDRELGWSLLHSPSRLQVFTIDSFCSRVVGGTPLLSRLGATPRVTDDARPLYREAVRRTLSSQGRALLGEPLEILLERYEMGMDRLEEQLVGMLGRRDQWREGTIDSRHDEKAWVERVERAFESAIDAEVAALADGLETELLSRLERIAVRSRAEKSADGVETLWPTLGEEDRLGTTAACAWAWKQAAELITKCPAGSRSRKMRTRSTRDDDIYGSDPALRADFRNLIEDITDSPRDWFARMRVAAKLPRSPVFTGDGRAALGAYLTVLRQADAALWQVFREAREVDYVEIAMGAVAALHPGETLEKLDARIEHILVDEFQDTNVLQCDLLRGLTSGWQQGDGRTLFLVGDPMQSIYRFRKAEVGLFLAARTQEGFLESCPLASETLAVNFRSTRQVVEWVNGAFATLFGDRNDASRSLVAFARAETRPEPEEGPDVDFILWSSPTPREKAEADALEARGLALWIADKLRRERVRGAEAEAEETGRGGTAPVAVLVRARNHALPLLRALETLTPGLRVRASELDHLADRQTAADLQALTRALLHPGDRLSWLALLRSPWIGLSLGEIAALVEPDVAEARECAARLLEAGELPDRRSRPQPLPLLLRDEAALARLPEAARARIAKLLCVLDSATEELPTRRLDVVLRSAWLRLGGPASRREEVGSDALDAEAYFDLLAARLRRGSVDLDELARSLAAADAPVARTDSVDVEILTIHKAKGLEFDTVILPALGRVAGGRDASPLAMETEAASGRLTLVTPRGARGRDDADSDKFEYLQLREKRRGDAETLRLLYVAATRAKKCLLLSAAEGRLKKSGEPGAGSLLQALAPALPMSAATLRQVDDADAAAARPMLRFPFPFRLETSAKSVADRSVLSENPSTLGEKKPEFFAAGKLHAHIGSVFHAFVERIAAEGIDAWPASRIDGERALIEHALRAEGVLASEMAEAAGRVVEALRSTLSHEKGRWMLAAHEEARSEWAVSGWSSGKLTSAKIDRSFVADGEQWIVDYKTGRLPTRISKEELARQIAAKREQYAPQLASYGALLRGRAERSLPLRLALWFPEWPEPHRWQDITGLAAAAPGGDASQGEKPASAREPDAAVAETAATAQPEKPSPGAGAEKQLTLGLE